MKHFFIITMIAALSFIGGVMVAYANRDAQIKKFEPFTVAGVWYTCRPREEITVKDIGRQP